MKTIKIMTTKQKGKGPFRMYYGSYVEVYAVFENGPPSAICVREIHDNTITTNV